MSAFFNIVLPVFALILIGWIAGRVKWLGEGAGQGISDFAFTLGIPALLCRTIATAKFGDLSPLAIWVSFFGAATVTWLIAAMLTRAPLGRPAIDAPSIGMSSTFGNTAMLGLPLCMTTFGPPAAAPIAIILSIHAPYLWLMGLLHSEAVGAREKSSPLTLLASIGRDLVRNPVIIGILLGVALRIVAQPLPQPIDRTLELLAQAGVPASLVALGLTLVKFEIKGQVPTLLTITTLKLLLMPLVAWLIADNVFHLSPVQIGVIVIMAAMPSGANAYLFATREGRAVNSASGAIALGTLLAAITTAFIISYVKL